MMRNPVLRGEPSTRSLNCHVEWNNCQPGSKMTEDGSTCWFVTTTQGFLTCLLLFFSFLIWCLRQLASIRLHYCHYELRVFNFPLRKSSRCTPHTIGTKQWTLSLFVRCVWCHNVNTWQRISHKLKHSLVLSSDTDVLSSRWRHSADRSTYLWLATVAHCIHQSHFLHMWWELPSPLLSSLQLHSNRLQT